MDENEMQRTLKFFHYPHPEARAAAGSALSRAVKNGADLSPIVPALVLDISTGSHGLSAAAAGLLTCHYRNKGEEGAIEKLLHHDVRSVRFGSAGALANIHMEQKDESRLMDMLGHADSAIREAARMPFEILALNSRSFEELDWGQRIFESGVRTWWKKQRSVAAAEERAERNEMQQKSVHVVRLFASRKTELAKRNDAELLAGETVPLPRARKGRIYRLESETRRAVR